MNVDGDFLYELVFKDLTIETIQSKMGFQLSKGFIDYTCF